MSEYGDPLSQRQVELAVQKALDLCRAGPDRSLNDHVCHAVAKTICACVLEIEDDIERHLSGTHAGILREVRRQVELHLAAPSQARDNPVDEASEESFPASDPPAWIWERPVDRKLEE